VVEQGNFWFGEEFGRIKREAIFMDGRPGEKRNFRIFLSACEPSGDAHCGHLIRALQSKACAGGKPGQMELEFVGVGGRQMEAAGCELLENTSDKAVMIYRAIAKLNYYKKLLGRLKEYFAEKKIDLLIVCDSPAFNFHLAKIANKQHVKTLFYVAPQLWAWAPWRIRKLHRLCDRLACILPFEEEWFSSRGVRTEFVGNPLFDNIDVDLEAGCKDYADFNPRAIRMALMPGSREAEIKKLYGPMQRIAGRLKVNHPYSEFRVCAVDEEKLKLLESKQHKNFECEYVINNVYQTARWADLTLVTSGSATMQVAAAGCPMIIMYQSSRIMWRLLGCWLVRTRFLSLVNILAGREVVPEFMPYFTKLSPIVARCNAYIGNKIQMVATSRELVDLAAPLTEKNASQNVAKMAIEMLNEK
jgi:lipid-A-disaccharide synthase